MAILAMAPFFAYVSALENGFIAEDHHGIVNNRLIGSLENLPELFRHHLGWSSAAPAVAAQRSTANYRPLPSATIFLEYALVGPRPLLYHVTPIVIHIANVFLLLLVAMRLGVGKSTARVAGLIFGVHPAIAEAIHLINARADSLTVLFFLAALAIWLRRDARPILASIAAAFLFFSATLCKETAYLLAAPVVFLVSGWRAAPRRAFGSLLPWAVGGALGLAARAAALGGMAVSVAPTDWGYMLARVPLIWLDALVSFVTGAAEIQPSLLESYRDPAAAKMVAAVVVAVSLLMLGAFALKRKKMVFVFGLCVFLLSLAPVALLTRQAAWFGWGRYLYLSAPFVALGFAVALTAVFRREWPGKVRFFAFGAAVALLVFLALQTFLAGRAYRDDRSFAEAAIADRPDISVGYTNLGDIELAQGNNPRALALAEKAIAIDPTDSRHHSLAAMASLQLGRFPEAFRAAERAIEIGVNDSRAAYVIAIRRLSEGREASAAKILVKVISEDPERAAPRETVRKALKQFGRNSEFARVLRERCSVPEHLSVAPAIRALLDEAPERSPSR